MAIEGHGWERMGGFDIDLKLGERVLENTKRGVEESKLNRRLWGRLLVAAKKAKQVTLFPKLRH